MQIWQVMLWPLAGQSVVAVDPRLLRPAHRAAADHLRRPGAGSGRRAGQLPVSPSSWAMTPTTGKATPARSHFTIGAAIFTLTRARTHVVAQEALIGIVYVVAAAGAILMLSQSAGGNEELRRSLVGEILVVSPTEIWRTFLAVSWGGSGALPFRRQFHMITYEPRGRGRRKECRSPAGIFCFMRCSDWWSPPMCTWPGCFGVLLSDHAGGLRQPAGR
jgi:hypothetical protein